jgi:hypothetical protein
MEYGGMVHALEEIHRLLRPSGTLIDIHPVAEASPIEIYHGGKTHLAGLLDVREWCVDYQEADKALTEVVQRGLFAVERQGLFDSPTYYGSVPEMYASLKVSLDKYARDAESAVVGLPDVEAVIGPTQELMDAAGSGGELSIRERIHIARLRPM